jgi:hypothetical protein
MRALCVAPLTALLVFAGGAYSAIAATSGTTPNASVIVSGLKCRGLPISNTKVYTAANDPNHLLGRSHGYTSKVNFVDSRLGPSTGNFDPSEGGSVEVFSSKDDAKARKQLIDNITQKDPALGDGYDYLEGAALLRLSNKLVPAQAKVYDSTFKTVLADPKKTNENCVKSAPAKTGSAKPPKPQAATASPYVGGTKTLRLPAGRPGKVDVVAVGPYDGNSLPVVVRNNLTHTAIRIGVAGTATTSAGKILATGADQGGLQPTYVKPGEIAFGYVYFHGVHLPSTAKFKLTAKPETADLAQYENERNLVVLSSSHIGDRVVGRARNTLGQKVGGPISTTVACFSTSGKLLYTASGFADQNDVAARQAIDFQADAPAPYGSGLRCALYLVALGGFIQP